MALQLGSIIFFCILLSWVDGHGRLLRPPARSSLWRFGYDSPANYEDNQMYCGGKSRQESLGGLCGICGDPYDEPVPRTNEIGGPVYRAYLTARYAEAQVIEAQVQITANHKGFIQFKICPVPGFDTEATQECLDRHVLVEADSNRTEIPILAGDRRVTVQLQLPVGLTCQHCVFQWRYHCGNSWGQCEDGSSAVGCGPQEEFYGCSDVAIGRRDQTPTDDRETAPEAPSAEEEKSVRPGPDVPPPSYGRPSDSTTPRATASLAPTTARPAARPAPATARPAARPAPTTARPAPTTTRPAPRPAPTTARPAARPAPAYGAARTCVSVGPLSRAPGMDDWCTLNCNHTPSYCPSGVCLC